MAVTADDLLAAGRTPGDRTEEGLRGNITVGIAYLQSWLRGNGAVGIHNLMEDAATAEISRAQLWQWRRQGVALADGARMSADLYGEVRTEQMAKLRAEMGTQEHRLDTGGRRVLDVTELVLAFCSSDGRDGLVNVFVPHATAGVALVAVPAQKVFMLVNSRMP